MVVLVFGWLLPSLGVNYEEVLEAIKTLTGSQMAVLLVLGLVAYKPVLKMLDERSRRIKESLEQAEIVKQHVVSFAPDLAESVVERYERVLDADRVRWLSGMGVQAWFPIEEARGHRIRFSGHLRTEAVGDPSGGHLEQCVAEI